MDAAARDALKHLLEDVRPLTHAVETLLHEDLEPFGERLEERKTALEEAGVPQDVLAHLGRFWREARKAHEHLSLFASVEDYLEAVSKGNSDGPIQPGTLRPTDN
jgi:hypothetical protein